MANAIASPTFFELNAFLAQDPLKLFIGGRWVPAKAGGMIETLDPGDGKVLARVAAADASDVDDAIRAARDALRHSCASPKFLRPVFSWLCGLAQVAGTG